MSLRINANIAALTAHLNLQSNDQQLSNVLEQLSTGLRINHSSDDPAGLAISDKMNAQSQGLDMASRNAQDGISMLQIGDSALGQTQDILQRMRQLAVQAANDTLTTLDRSNLNVEMDQLSSEIDRIASDTNFNTMNLLDGSLATAGVTVQIGANTGQTLTITIATATASALSVDVANLKVDDAADASTTIATIDAALDSVSSNRGNIGAAINHLTMTMDSLGAQSENLVSARSRITDLDMASAVVDLSRDKIMEQASTSMLAQANQAPDAILALLKNG